MTTTWLRSDEVIQNLMANRGFENSQAYAYAFGYCWAMLSETQQLKLIEMSLKDGK